MCGLAAIFAYQHSALSVDLEELRRIRDHMSARGPDGSGEWVSADQRVALGHRRLAVIDLDTRSAQPMTSTSGNLRIVFNGEIYNYRELRQRFERQGATFRTESDTEVLLVGYEIMGADLFLELRGMYAIALFDESSRRLVLARDPYGIKPLYYADDGWTLRAASQVKALLAGGGISAQKEPAGLIGFLMFGSVPEPFTCYQDIRVVPAGTCMEIDSFGIRRFIRHADHARELSNAQPADATPEELAETLRDAIRDSVRAHMIADVPIGSFLSGGIDSGALVGLMRDACDKPLFANTIVFEEFEGSPLDESKLASESARLYGLEHCRRLVRTAELEDDLPRILAGMDQPSIDGINTWFAAKSCREQGLKVAVSGVGGDELLGGYPSFHSVPRWHRWSRLPARIPGLGRITRAATHPVLRRRNPNQARASGMIEYAGTIGGAYLLRRGLFMPFELPELVGSELAEEGLQRLSAIDRINAQIDPDPGSDFARVLCLESSWYLRNQLLRDCDWAAMAHSIEVRTPLVDWQLFKDLAPLIRSGRLVGGKLLLGAAPSKPLPPSIIDRAKTGFVAPLVHSPWPQWMTRKEPTNRSGARRFLPGHFRLPARNLAAHIWQAQDLAP